MGMSRGNCTTHHFACDCREEHFRKMEAELNRLTDEMKPDTRAPKQLRKQELRWVETTQDIFRALWNHHGLLVDECFMDSDGNSSITGALAGADRPLVKTTVEKGVQNFYLIHSTKDVDNG